MKRNLVFKLMLVLVAASVLLSACGPAPTPVVVEKEKVVEKPVIQTVVVEKEKVVEKPVVQTVVVEKVVEKEVTPAAPVEFVFAHPGPIYTMDAPVTWYGSTHWLTNLLYDCLIWRNQDASGYHGQSAERWENVDPTTWRFYLREGLTFHNGEPLDANAVKWNIDRVRSRKDFQVVGQWAFVKDVIVVDDWTVDITTHEPFTYFEFNVSYNGCELLPPKYIEEVGEEEFSRHPVGSGPYRLVKFIANERYEFEAWDDYWGGRPEVDRVVYQVIPDTASRVAALLAGQVDMVNLVPLPEIDRVCNTKGIDCVRQASGRNHTLYLRSGTEVGDMEDKYPGYQPAVLDKRIRHAISHALDRNLLGEVQGSGYPTLVRISRHYPEVSTFADRLAGPDVAAKWYDPELAKKLIKEAGYDPDAGKKPKVHIDAPANWYGNEKEVAEVIKAMLEDVGFEVTLQVLDATAFREQIIATGSNRDIMLTTYGTTPGWSNIHYYHCEWWDTYHHDCVPEWDAVGEQILVTVDPKQYLALFDIWWDYYLDHASTVTLYEMEYTYAINAKFKWMPRVDGWATFRDLTLTK